MEIHEDDGKGGYSSVPLDKDCFKLRQNTKKKISLTVSQPSAARPLIIDRYVYNTVLSPRLKMDCLYQRMYFQSLHIKFYILVTHNAVLRVLPVLVHVKRGIEVSVNFGSIDVPTVGVGYGIHLHNLYTCTCTYTYAHVHII